jgi:hypothetical protein
MSAPPAGAVDPPPGATGAVSPASAPPPVAAPVPVTVPPAPLQIPSLTRRIILGSLRAFGMILLFLVVPYLLLHTVAPAVHLRTPIGLAPLLGLGLAVVILSTAAYIARPTRAYGPLLILGGIIGILYLLYLASVGEVALGGGQVGIALGFRGLFLIAALVPFFGLCQGLVLTLEDLRRPGERIGYEYAPRLG